MLATPGQAFHGIFEAGSLLTLRSTEIACKRSEICLRLFCRIPARFLARTRTFSVVAHVKISRGNSVRLATIEGTLVFSALVAAQVAVQTS